MSSFVEHPRRRRSRIVVLGNVATDDSEGRIADVFEEVELASNLFDVVGRIAQSSARAPVGVVVLDASVVDRPLKVVVEAIRGVDPSVLLYLATRSGDEDALDDEAIDAGFDGLLLAPLTGEMLVGLSQGTMPATGRDSVTPTSPPTDAPTTNRRTPTNAGNLTDTADATVAASEDATHARPTHHPGVVEPESPPLSEAPPSPDEADRVSCEDDHAVTLGDIDLVEAILHERAKVHMTALDIIRQETGWKDLVFIENAGDGSGAEGEHGGEHIVLIEHDGRSLGALQCAHATRNDLTRWAAWLGPWLALAARHEQLREMAYRDALTGAWNRRYYEEFITRTLDEARHERRTVTIAVFDVDDLKIFNDRYGHDAGDEVLSETVKLIRSMVRKGDRVCRIGGDEFVIVFADAGPPRKPGSVPLESIERIVRRFQEGICQMRFPKLGPDAPGTLSISAGLATFPWDGHDASSLVRTADLLALESKRRGKNALTIGPGAKAQCDRGIFADDCGGADD